MASLSPTPKLQFFGTDGLPLVGGKLYTYAAGTTTPLATYTSAAGTSSNTNPIILDSNGEADVWLLNTLNYKYVLKTSEDVLMYTVDYISVPLTTTSFAAPPPIGDLTPNVGTFTNLNVIDLMTLEGTGASILNVGTTGERPISPEQGMVRYNSTLTKFEGYNGSWGQLGGGATGGGSDQIFVENGQTVTADYTITTNFNAMSTGPISIDTGITVTIPTGAVWVVL